MRSHQKSQPNGITVPPLSSSSTNNLYGGSYNQMASHPTSSMYPPAYKMYTQPPLPPGPPPSS